MADWKSKRWRGVALGSLLALGASSWARTAAACGACSCDDEPRSIVTLIRDVPLNLELPLRVLAEGEAPPRLERVSDGAVAPATVTEDPSAGVWWLKVDRDLEPATEYRIVRDAGVEAQFTSGAARDAQAPTLGGVDAMPGGNGGLCGTQIGARLTLTGVNDDNQQFAAWVELEVDVAGTAQNLYLPYSFTGVIGIGHSEMGCFGPAELAGVSAGQGYPSRARLRDAGGNIGDWQTFVVTLAEGDPGGCGTPVVTAGSGGMNGAPDPTDGGSDVIAGSAGASPDSGFERTSKGCGCALGAERGAPWGVGALGLMASQLLRRRRSA